MFAYNFLFSPGGKRLIIRKKEIKGWEGIKGVIRKEICGWKSH
jgi:hypothetical protein